MGNVGKSMKEYYVQHKWIQYMLCFLLVVGILMIIMPFVLSAGYTYLCEDDFSFEGGARDAAEQYGELKGAFVASHRYYLTWQGTYFSNFIWHIVRPYIRGGMPGFHAVMIGGIILFFLALFVAIKMICKEKLYSLSIAFLVVSVMLCMSDTFGLKEILFWYTGAVNYLWVLSFSLLTLAFQLKIKAEPDKKKQWTWGVLSVISGLIGSGGTLMITAVQCACLLLVIVLSYDEIKEKKMIIVPFAAAFLGALWNACAPGNFVRNDHTMSEQNYGVWKAICDTLLSWKEHMVKLFNVPLFILILAIVFIITFSFGTKIISKGINNLKMFLVILGVFAIQYLAAFPVVLGYHGSLYNMRTTSTFDLIIKITMIFAMICLAQWSQERFTIARKIFPIIMVFGLMFGIFNGSEIKEEINNGYTYNLARDLSNGTILEVYKVREATLSQLESAADGEDVVIFANPIPDNETMYGMGLLEDSGAFVNTSAAGMFKLNSITVIYK